MRTRFVALEARDIGYPFEVSDQGIHGNRLSQRGWKVKKEFA